MDGTRIVCGCSNDDVDVVAVMEDSVPTAAAAAASTTATA